MIGVQSCRFVTWEAGFVSTFFERARVPNSALQIWEKATRVRAVRD
jgi:hypothetical protein